MTGTFLSTQGKNKPTIILFRKHDNARNIMKFYKDLNIKTQQEICVEKVNIVELIRMCKNVGLDVSIIDDNVMFSLKPDDDYIHILNRSLHSAK